MKNVLICTLVMLVLSALPASEGLRSYLESAKSSLTATSRATVMIISPAEGETYLLGQAIRATTTDPSEFAHDRVVFLIGNSGSAGKYIFAPGFSGFFDRKATSSSALVIDQIFLDALPQFLPGAIPEKFFIEERGEVTSNHLITGDRVSDAFVSRSGFFTIKKELSFGVTFDSLSGTVSPVAGKEGSWSGGFKVNPAPSSSVSVSANVNWGDGASEALAITMSSGGNYTFSLKHAYGVGSVYNVTVTVIVSGVSSSAVFTITVSSGPIIIEIDPQTGDIVYSGGTSALKLKASRFNTRTGKLNISLSGIGK